LVLHFFLYFYLALDFSFSFARFFAIASRARPTSSSTTENSSVQHRLLRIDHYIDGTRRTLQQRTALADGFAQATLDPVALDRAAEHLADGEPTRASFSRE
jgi:hypothetical protein